MSELCTVLAVWGALRDSTLEGTLVFCIKARSSSFVGKGPWLGGWGGGESGMDVSWHLLLRDSFVLTLGLPFERSRDSCCPK